MTEAWQHYSNTRHASKFVKVLRAGHGDISEQPFLHSRSPGQGHYNSSSAELVCFGVLREVLGEHMFAGITELQATCIVRAACLSTDHWLYRLLTQSV